MQVWLRRWGVAALLLAGGALLRYFFLLHHKPFAGDAVVYADLTGNMLHHHIFGFTTDTGIQPTLIRLPGYPLFLAVCFLLFGAGNFMAVLWVQLVISLATCCLLALLAERLSNRRVGLITLGLAALCPFTANYSATPLTECCSLFCVALAFFSLERWTAKQRRAQPWNRWLLPLGLSLSFAVLVRPDQALLAMVVIPAMAWIGVSGVDGTALKRLAPAAAVTAALLLPLLLWGVRNWHVFHVIQPLAPRYANDPGESVPFGFQRWYRTWAVNYEATVNVYWKYDGLPLSLADLPPRAFDSPAQKAQTARVYWEYNDYGSANQKLDDEFAALAAQRIATHPIRYYIEVPFLKLADMWLRPRTELMKMPIDWWRFHAHPRQTVESFTYAALNFAYLVLAAVGLWRWRRFGWSRQHALAFAMIAFVLLRNLLLWTLDNSEARYTLECFPIVILLAALAFLPRRKRS